jgi:hypothetical protein
VESPTPWPCETEFGFVRIRAKSRPKSKFWRTLGVFALICG